MRNNLIARGIGHVPGLRRLPVFKLLALAEIAMLARAHVYHLDPQERRRLVQLVQTSRGRKGNLTAAERKELADLLGKMEPRLFAGMAADKLSPVPLPKRFTQGPRSERKEREEREQAKSSASD
jgi:hypothetical protein